MSDVKKVKHYTHCNVYKSELFGHFDGQKFSAGTTNITIMVSCRGVFDNIKHIVVLELELVGSFFN